VKELAQFDGWHEFIASHLSVDPGLCTGWASWDQKHALLHCGVGTPPNCEKHLVIEYPQIYPNQPVPPNDLITLAIQVGRYAQTAIDCGSKVSLVLPHEWKGNLPKKICNARIMKILSVDEKAIANAVKLPETKRHNMMDAIGIGLYAFRGMKI
jgi:hypothetical protein